MKISHASFSFLTLIALVLVLAIATPSKRAIADPQPQVAAVGCLIVTIAVGVTVVWGLIKICNRAFPANTNAPATNSPPVTNPPPGKTAAEFTNVAVTITLTIESCTNLTAAVWAHEGHGTATIGDGYVTFVTTNNVGEVLTNSSEIASMTYKGVSFWSVTNDVRSIIHEQVGEPKKFWRLVAP